MGFEIRPPPSKSPARPEKSVNSPTPCAYVCLCVREDYFHITINFLTHISIPHIHKCRIHRQWISGSRGYRNQQPPPSCNITDSTKKKRKSLMSQVSSTPFNRFFTYQITSTPLTNSLRPKSTRLLLPIFHYCVCFSRPDKSGIGTILPANWRTKGSGAVELNTLFKY